MCLREKDIKIFGSLCGATCMNGLKQIDLFETAVDLFFKCFNFWLCSCEQLDLEYIPKTINRRWYHFI